MLLGTVLILSLDNCLKKFCFKGMLVLLLVPESPYYLAWKTGDVEAARPRYNKPIPEANPMKVFTL